MLLFSHIFFTKEFCIFAEKMNQYTNIHTHKEHEGEVAIVSWRIGTEPKPATKLLSAGIHPWDAEVLYPTLEALVAELESVDCVAIGEIGLDKACNVPLGIQQEVFARQVEVASRRGLPIVIHCVRAQAEVVAELQKHPLQSVVFHGFIGSKEQAEELLRKGYYLSFGFGALRSPKTMEALREMPLDRLFLESDTAERPIEELYRRVAKEKNIDIERLKKIILDNYTKLFR